MKRLQQGMPELSSGSQRRSVVTVLRIEAEPTEWVIGDEGDNTGCQSPFKSSKTRIRQD